MFADSLQLPYPLLSDYPDLEVIRRYGALASNGQYPHRFFFLIDQQGIVRGKWIGEDSGVFSNEPLLKAVEEIAGKPAEDAGGKKASGM
jgi:peroxiredoxin